MSKYNKSLSIADLQALNPPPSDSMQSCLPDNVKVYNAKDVAYVHMYALSGGYDEYYSYYIVDPQYPTNRKKDFFFNYEGLQDIPSYLRHYMFSAVKLNAYYHIVRSRSEIHPPETGSEQSCPTDFLVVLHFIDE